MSNEEFTDKVEAAIVGVVHFAMRLLRTFGVLVYKPGQLLEAVRGGFAQKRYITPHAFLLSCAIATGIFGKVIAEGMTQLGTHIIGQFKDVTVTSFLEHSVPVFLIAIAATLLVEIFLRGQQAERKQTFKRLNFYVIGFFGIGGLALLLLLSLFLKVSFDQFGPGTELFRYGSSTAVAGYVLGMLMLLYWLTSHAIKGPDSPTLPAGVSLRIFVIDVIVIALCAVNFASPLGGSGDADEALEGRIVDLTREPDSALRLTFLLRNSGDADAVVSRIDKVALVLKEKQTDALTAYDARFCSSQQPGKAESGFLLLASGKSEVVSICLNSKALNTHLETSGLVSMAREQGGERLASSASSKSRLGISVRLSSLSGGRYRIDLPVELCCL